MKVSEIMHSGVASIHQDLPLREVPRPWSGGASRAPPW